MASNSSSNHNKRRTSSRLKEANEKRIVEDHLQDQDEFKRQKKMFAPGKVPGPREIVVNFNMNENSACSSLIKQETLEVDTTGMTEPNDRLAILDHLNIKLEDESSVVIKVEETSDVLESPVLAQLNEFSELSEPCKIKLDDESSIVVKLEDDNILQNHLKLLQARANQKDEEIQVLIRMITELQLRLSAFGHQTPNEEIQNELTDQDDSQINIVGEILTSNWEYRQILAPLITDLTNKDAKISILSTKMVGLQNELFDMMDKNSQILENDQSLGNEMLDSFEMVLPFIYPDLQLNDILACRKTSRNWKTAVDTFLNTHPSKLPFDKKTHSIENKKLELGRIPTWNISPLKKLFDKYRFSDVDELDNFTKGMNSVIIDSTVCLDDIILLDANKLIRFLVTFGLQINYLEIRQCIHVATFKIHLFMDRVKLCLAQFQNLRQIRLVLSFIVDPINREQYFNLIEDMDKKSYVSWQISTFPKLEKLESIVIDNTEIDCSVLNPTYLCNFSNCLVAPYLKQLKQLSMFTYGYYDFETLDQLNLIQLTIPWKLSMGNRDFCLERVEKVTITSTVFLLQDNDILRFQKWFPNLVCLGFKCEPDGGKLADFFSRPYFVELNNIVTLELENYDAVEFGVLRCFPKLRYLNLISTRFIKRKYRNNETILNITSLCQGDNLYDIKNFWKSLPNISLVVLEFNGTPQKTVGPKTCIWTRQNYIQYP